MQGGFKHANLPADVQRKMRQIEEEMTRIRAQIASKKVQKEKTMAQIEVQKDLLRKENSKKISERDKLEKEIQGIDGEIRRINQKYAPQLKPIDDGLAEINKEIENAVKQHGDLRGKSPQDETKVAENLNVQKAQLQNQIRDLENKLREVNSAIQRLSQKSLSKIPQKEVISTEPQLQVRRAEKDRLEKKKKDIETIIAGEVNNLNRKKQDLIAKQGKLEEDLRVKASSLELTKLENLASALGADILALEGRESNLLRGLDTEISRAKR